MYLMTYSDAESPEMEATMVALPRVALLEALMEYKYKS